MISLNSRYGVLDRLNLPWTPKPCAITYENGHKCPKSPQTTKSCAIAHVNGTKWHKSRVFYDFKKLVYGVPDCLNPSWTPKMCAIIHEKCQKWPKSRVFDGFMKVMLRGLEPFKSTQDPKTVCYSPRKRPEMAEIVSFSRFYETRVIGSRTV